MLFHPRYNLDRFSIFAWAPDQNPCSLNSFRRGHAEPRAQNARSLLVTMPRWKQSSGLSRIILSLVVYLCLWSILLHRFDAILASSFRWITLSCSNNLIVVCKQFPAELTLPVFIDLEFCHCLSFSLSLVCLRWSYYTSQIQMRSCSARSKSSAVFTLKKLNPEGSSLESARSSMGRTCTCG